MPAFTLYGARGSTNTDRVRLTLAEGGFMDYEIVFLNLQEGEQKVGDRFISRSMRLLLHKNFLSPMSISWSWRCYIKSKEHTKRHPWGKIPVLTFPDGFTLYESRVICKYLAKKYAIPLLPPDTEAKAAALFDQAQSAEMSYFAEFAGKIAFEKFVKKFIGLPPDEAIVSDALRSVQMFFDVAERLLQDREYMAGNDFTLVDIYYIPLIQRLFVCGYGDIIASREAVSAWWERCVNRPAIQRILAADKEAVVAASK